MLAQQYKSTNAQPDPAAVKFLQQLENAGYVAYYNGTKRHELVTDAERRGWATDAAGEMAYYKAMLAEERRSYVPCQGDPAIYAGPTGVL